MSADRAVFPHEPCMRDSCGHRFDMHEYGVCNSPFCPCNAYTGPPTPSDVCQRAGCAHLYREHGTIGCRMTLCRCAGFDTQPREDYDMHPDEKVPAQLFRVPLTLDINVVSHDGFGGAAEEAMQSVRRVFDNVTDRASVVAVTAAAP